MRKPVFFNRHQWKFNLSRYLHDRHTVAGHARLRLIFIGAAAYALMTNFQRPKTLIKDSSR